MDAVTYPQVEVITFLNEHFECLKINEKSPSKLEMELMRSQKFLWSPAFIFTDHLGNEMRKMVGFRNPVELLAEASMALGKVNLLHSKPAIAGDWFERAHQLSTEYETAPEALYWLAIARFRAAKGNKDILWEIWERLRKEFPSSKWAASADCKDFAPELYRKPALRTTE